MADVETSNFKIGPANVYLGGTAPATGGFIDFDAQGVPDTGGVFVGATEGPVKITIENEEYEPDVEQAIGTIATYVIGESIQVEFETLEVTAQNINNALTVSELTEGVGFDAVTGGGNQCITDQVLTLVTGRACAESTLYIGLCIYSAYPSEGLEMEFTKKENAKIPFTFKGHHLLSRPKGDQLYQIVEQTA